MAHRNVRAHGDIMAYGDVVAHEDEEMWLIIEM